MFFYEKIDKEIFEDAALAYKFLMKLRTMRGIITQTSKELVEELFGTREEIYCHV